MIVETEAYRGYNDLACHANEGLRTKRNQVMYRSGGLSYVYLCYGIHHLFNVVTNGEGHADAVLIRAIQPELGLEVMRKRRNLDLVSTRLTSGPGLVTQALGIRLDHYGTELTETEIWIEDKSVQFERSEISSGPRVGIAYAEAHTLYPWRFYISSNKWVSTYKSGTYHERK